MISMDPAGRSSHGNHRVIMRKMLSTLTNTLAPSFLIGSSSYLQVTRTAVTFQLRIEIVLLLLLNT